MENETNVKRKRVYVGAHSKSMVVVVGLVRAWRLSV